MAFGQSADEIAKKIEKLFKPQVPEGFASKIKFIPKLIELAKTPPKMVANAPCQEVVHSDPDLSTIPVIKCWPGDGGKFITFPMVITKSIDDSTRNMGMYRIQIYDKNTTGMHWYPGTGGAQHYAIAEAMGKPLPVAVMPELRQLQGAVRRNRGRVVDQRLGTPEPLDPDSMEQLAPRGVSPQAPGQSSDPRAGEIERRAVGTGQRTRPGVREVERLPPPVLESR
jgi:hypothetical protein